MSEDVLCALIVKFGITLVLAIAGVALSLRVLSDLFCEEVLKILFPTVDVADLRCLYKCVQKLSKFLCFNNLDHPPHVLSPPVIDVYAASHSCKATIDQLKLISIIVILKCNRCGNYYRYSKYRNPSSRWNLYDSPRIAIEGSDVRFVQHRLMEWQVSLA